MDAFRFDWRLSLTTAMQRRYSGVHSQLWEKLGFSRGPKPVRVKTCELITLGTTFTPVAAIL
jgi:hypothetical protein